METRQTPMYRCTRRHLCIKSLMPLPEISLRPVSCFKCVLDKFVTDKTIENRLKNVQLQRQH